MAKKKSDVEKFKAAKLVNFKDIDAEFGKLDTFIEEHELIPDSTRSEVKKIVAGYRERCNAKNSHVNNLFQLNSAIEQINSHVEYLNN